MKQLTLPATISINLPLPLKTPNKETIDMKEHLKLLFHNNSPRFKEIPMVSAREVIIQNSTRVVSNSQLNVSTKLAKILTVLKDAQSKYDLIYDSFLIFIGFDWKERIARIHETIEVADIIVSRE